MADTADYSSSLANEGSPSPPQITVVSEPDIEPEQDSPSQEHKATDQLDTFKFKCSPAAPLGESSGSSSFKHQFSFENKMSGLKPAAPVGSSPLRASFLRPSQLPSPDKSGSAENNANKSSFPLKPARLANPFAKANDNTEASEETAEASQATNSVALSLPKFVPLGAPPSSQPRANPTPTPQVTTASVVTSGFVFGQNLHEKVTEVTSAETSTVKRDSPEAVNVNNGASCSNVVVASNGSTENLFTSVLKKEQVEKNNDSGGESSGDRPSKSLSEAAREYEEARAVKRKYEEVAVVTGEEDEVNVLQINCKLFAFDKVKSSWVERGRGNLRLNDKDIGSGQKQSRVIMRATGSLRVVLNTKLWPGMVVDKVSSKSVRLTAMDAISGEILVFLVMASPKEADFLYNYMESRVAALKASCAETASSYPDASRSSNTGSNLENCSGSGESSLKKLSVKSDVGSSVTNSSASPQASNSAEDSGGNDDSFIDYSGDEDSALS